MMMSKLEQLSQDDNFRGKIAAVMDEVKAHGTETYIVSALRTLAEQKEKVDKGYSETTKSYHLAHGSDRLSWAADIVPKESGYHAPKWFWLLQAHIAMGHGLGCGIFFGLHDSAFKSLVKFLKNEGGGKFDPNAWEGPIGWDPSHIQASRNW